MAYYSGLVSVVQLLKDITHHRRYPNFLPDKHQFHVSLYAKFNLLLELLDDYSPKDHEEEANDILERRIRDAAYRTQDMIESHISSTLLPHIHLEKRTGAERLQRLWASTFGHAPDNIWESKYYRDLRKVKREVDSIVGELIRIKAQINTTHMQPELPNPYTSAQASKEKAPSGSNTMVVFDDHLMATTIKAQLCGESSKLEVISISGMGGLGKTHLARSIFDENLIHDRFDRRVWVIVSQDYHLENILLAIVNSLNIKEELDADLKKKKEELDRDGKKELDEDTKGVMQKLIYQNLFGRRYLIILDDVWEAKFWDDIRRIFPDNSNGSRVMLTTRLADVAEYLSSSKFHHKKHFLDEDQSWILLRKKVFAQEHCPEELEITGKLIAKGCGGLPLAIVVIAGVLLNVERTQYEWQNIARKVRLTAIDQNDKHLSTILSLSYNHLPHHLKPCFLSLGGYPEDHEICISKLIWLWIAEGFIKPIESKSLEEVGEEYFRDLVNRNLILITGKKSNGKFKSCIIHDILRELCSRKAHDENFLLCVQQKDDFWGVPIGNVRRVYFQAGDESPILEYMKKHGSHVRSLIRFSNFRGGLSSAAFGCKLLRIFDTKAGIWSTASDKILELLHLRYLHLRLDRMDTFPSRVFLLQNLQTLIFDSYASLPSKIWKLSQLRHVMCKKGVKLPPIPYGGVKIADGIPLLGSLKTLSRVVYTIFRSDIIEMIPNLKKLRFKCELQIVHVWEDYGLRNLVNLHQLETLYIEFRSSIKKVPLPENFAFPSTIEKLTLDGCKLPWKDMTAVGSLPNLQVLKLRSDAFLGEEWEPTEGEFLKLKFLLMEKLHDLKYWRAENTHFPSLKQLHIIEWYALEEIPLGIGDIPTLQLIKLELACFSNQALKSSALEIQEQQRDLGNDDLQVHIA